MTGQFVDLTKSNIGSFAQLYVDVFNAPPWNVAWTLPAASERLGSFSEFPRFQGLGCISESGPIAFILGWGERWSKGWVFHVKEMGVATTAQRHGVGRELLAKFEQNLTAEDYISVYLETGTNTPARRFYANGGYTTLDLASLHKKL